MFLFHMLNYFGDDMLLTDTWKHSYLAYKGVLFLRPFPVRNVIWTWVQFPMVTEIPAIPGNPNYGLIAVQNSPRRWSSSINQSINPHGTAKRNFQHDYRHAI